MRHFILIITLCLSQAILHAAGNSIDEVATAAKKMVSTPLQKDILFLCYPTDDMIKESCGRVKKELEKCGYTVSVLYHPTPEEAKAKANALPIGTPVFVSSHGVSYQKKHYLYSNKGTTKEDFENLGKPDPLRLPSGVTEFEITAPSSDSKLQRTLPILQAVGPRPVFLSACFSGRVCTEMPVSKMIASCSFDEVSSQNGKGMEHVEHAMVKLYCSEKEWNKVDQYPQDGRLNNLELGLYLGGKMGTKQETLKLFATHPPTKEGGNDNLYLSDHYAKVTILKNDKDIEKQAHDLIATLTKEATKKSPVTEKYQYVEEGIIAEASYEHDGKTIKFQVPGIYSEATWAESIARGMIKEKTGKKFDKVSMTVLGKAFSIRKKSLNRPCGNTGLGGEQYPQLYFDREGLESPWRSWDHGEPAKHDQSQVNH